MKKGIKGIPRLLEHPQTSCSALNPYSLAMLSKPYSVIFTTLVFITTITAATLSKYDEDNSGLLDANLGELVESTVLGAGGFIEGLGGTVESLGNAIDRLAPSVDTSST